MKMTFNNERRVKKKTFSGTQKVNFPHMKPLKENSKVYILIRKDVFQMRSLR
jgi:hypothetical protein